MKKIEKSHETKIFSRLMEVKCKKCGKLAILHPEWINSPNCRECSAKLAQSDDDLVSAFIKNASNEFRKNEEIKAQRESQLKAEITQRRAKMETPEGLAEVLMEYLNYNKTFAGEYTEGMEDRLDIRPGGLVKLKPGEWDKSHKTADEFHRDYAMKAVSKLNNKYIDLDIPDQPIQTENAKADIQKYQNWASSVHRITGKSEEKTEAATDEMKADLVTEKKEKPTPKDTGVVGVTLIEFMQDYCIDPLSGSVLESRKKSLFKGNLHSEIELPEPLGEWKSGKTKRFDPEKLKKKWPDYRRFNSNLPRLKVSE